MQALRFSAKDVSIARASKDDSGVHPQWWQEIGDIGSAEERVKPVLCNHVSFWIAGEPIVVNAPGH
jgi:hypothetical protein